MPHGPKSTGVKKRPVLPVNRKKRAAHKNTPLANHPRGAAWSILERMGEGDQPLDTALERFFETSPSWERRDINLLHALVFGVQRRRATLDHVIHHLSNIPLPKIDPAVLNVLRVGIFQILYMDRIPDSAAVNTAVDITKTFAPRWTAGFVNGLLRAAVRSRDRLPFPDIRTDPVHGLAVVKSFPEWLIRRWLDRWGAEEAARLCDALNRTPPITLRTNTLRTDRDGLAAALDKEVDLAVPTHHSPDGVIVSGISASIRDLSAFHEGLFQVQDEAAQLVSRFLGPLPGETVMDACAGLGGKTGHLAALMENRGRLAAVEVYSRKLSILEGETRRLGISIVTPVCHDLDQGTPPCPYGPFDRILLDAPCSGLGVLARNPDAKWSPAKKDLAGYRNRQIRFLTHLAPLVKPSGLLAYAVCSMEPEEAEDVVSAFLEKHPNFSVHRDFPRLPPKARALITPEGYLRTFPHRDDMDGFFSVCFARKM
ncbi:16S rRNA (cytosine(967)-C(5))-methyltransferase RsmB [Desulfococcus sp.]|uniref:16S rRNA (cytosine(967)-C(5))-methyltransferase RsmB n=1 Tax=Desulfococcus sp. TaxID=2025834 RepID=UPI003592ED9F